MQTGSSNGTAQLRRAKLTKLQMKKGDNYLLRFKGEGNDPSSQRGRGRRPCVGVGAFWFEVCRHLRKTNKVMHKLTQLITDAVGNFLRNISPELFKLCRAITNSKLLPKWDIQNKFRRYWNSCPRETNDSLTLSTVSYLRAGDRNSR